MRMLLFMLSPTVVSCSSVIGGPQWLQIEETGADPSSWADARIGPKLQDKPNVDSLQANPFSRENPHPAFYCHRWTYGPRLGPLGSPTIAWPFIVGDWGGNPKLSEESQYHDDRALNNAPVKSVFFEVFHGLLKSGPELSWGKFHADRSPMPTAALAKPTRTLAQKVEGRS